MSKRLPWLGLVLLLLPLDLLALHVKVVSVDHKAGLITVLLPMHNTLLEASLGDDEAETRVRVSEFYEAELVSGKVDTTKRNYLRIKIPNERPVNFRLRRISFLE